MATYRNPAIAHRASTSKGSVVPVFTFEEVNLGGPAHHYWWADLEGGPLRIFHLFTASRPPEGLKQQRRLVEIFVGGRSLQVSSSEAFQRLARLLPWDNTRKLEPIAPSPEEAGIDRFTTDRVGRSKLLDDLQQALCDLLVEHFRGAWQAQSRGQSLAPYFKGLSIGTSQTPAGLFMKGVKTAYDGLGFRQQAYKGLRFKEFQLKDLIEYVSAYRKAYPRTLALDAPPGWRRRAKSEFQEPCPVAPFSLPGIKPHDSRIPTEYLQLIKDTMAHWLVEASSGELTGGKTRLMPLRTKEKIASSEVFDGRKAEPVIVHEYGFRGDGRSPVVLSITGGMNANAVRHFEGEGLIKAQKFRTELEERARDDYYHHPAPHFDPFLHQHNYDAISVFLSVSRDPVVSHSFLMGSRPANGFMYLVRAMGAVDQEATFKVVQYPGEQEISVPGGVDWEDIVAARPIVEGEPVDYCYFNEANRWRKDPKEREVQERALGALMLFQIAPEIMSIIEGDKMLAQSNK